MDYIAKIFHSRILIGEKILEFRAFYFSYNMNINNFLKIGTIVALISYIFRWIEVDKEKTKKRRFFNWERNERRGRTWWELVKLVF
ncbi:hypothetical protein [Desulfitobacterium metallireducens]|uniref:hypothetical protein n=1 Tax=Desulfitobacterium metallireducens TaxID=142877 RepID=UPI00023152AF|nr:hypothetical protein [Desulfitobacterium metallireducens]